jgi:hypothetical protein
MIFSTVGVQIFGRQAVIFTITPSLSGTKIFVSVNLAHPPYMENKAKYVKMSLQHYRHYRIQSKTGVEALD